MPRKNKIPASAAQNRENQRRSRARHRQFIKELQERVSRYEREGTQASIEMQQVAKAVKYENQQLRALLHRYGVSQQEIDRHLQLAAHNDAASIAPVGHPRQYFPRISSRGIDQPSPSTLHTERSPIQNEDTQPNSSAPITPGIAHSPQSQRQMPLLARTNPCGPATPATSTAPLHAFESCETPNSPHRSSISFICNDGTPHTDIQTDILPQVSDCFCPPEMPTPDLGQKSKGIHCKAAVDLVAGMQHNIQVDEVKGWLRCGDSDDCEVQSSRLFQLMDKIA